MEKLSMSELVLKKYFGKKSYANDRRRLNRALKQFGIEFNCFPLYDGYKWLFPNHLGDAVIHSTSYDNQCGKFETFNMPWDNGHVTTHSAKELARLLYELENEDF